jgi:hypothetical protein
MTCEEWWRHTTKICIVFDQFQYQHPWCWSPVSFISSATYPVYVSIEICFSPNIVSWDSLVGIVTRLRAGRTSVGVLAQREFFSSPSPSSHLFIGYRGFFPWRKWLGCETDYSRPSSDMAELYLLSPYIPSLCVHGHIYLYLVPLSVNCWYSGSEECKLLSSCYIILSILAISPFFGLNMLHQSHD